MGLGYGKGNFIYGRARAYPDDQLADPYVGHWAVAGLPRQIDHRTIFDVLCPYCREPLSSNVEAAKIGRISKHLGDGNVVLEMTPPTHIAMGCRTCKLGFSVPECEKWPV